MQIRVQRSEMRYNDSKKDDQNFRMSGQASNLRFCQVSHARLASVEAIHITPQIDAVLSIYI